MAKIDEDYIFVKKPKFYYKLLMSKVTCEVWNVLDYIILVTYGFHRTSAPISYFQFENGIVGNNDEQIMGGCGVGEAGVRKALAFLKEIGAIRISKGYTEEKGLTYEVETDPTKIRIDIVDREYQKRVAVNTSRTEKARKSKNDTKEIAPLSDKDTELAQPSACPTSNPQPQNIPEEVAPPDDSPCATSNQVLVPQGDDPLSDKHIKRYLKKEKEMININTIVYDPEIEKILSKSLYDFLNGFKRNYPNAGTETYKKIRDFLIKYGSKQIHYDLLDLIKENPTAKQFVDHIENSIKENKYIELKDFPNDNPDKLKAMQEAMRLKCDINAI